MEQKKKILHFKEFYGNLEIFLINDDGSYNRIRTAIRWTDESDKWNLYVNHDWVGKTTDPGWAQFWVREGQDGR